MSAFSLPDKPSALLRLAVSDAQKCEADPRYELRMSTWHRPNYYNYQDADSPLPRCLVCMAGAVMAQTFGLDPSEQSDPEDCEDETTRRRLNAIDDMRRGHLLWAAILVVGAAAITDEQRHTLIDLSDNANAMYDVRASKAGFSTRLAWPDYLKIADELEAINL